ncbi:hypothetical protein EST38_g13530 [Candolleomyces aberdarensis]|uniref:Uncharacterized protein n=1 Tax=Candolleomyces aberdarensis TaxID=2316362 RepID=A0A4Q2D200_9AGAR|nr:hypothetical protein EST38_g13530 [Candolleomyces aberdarensis]
MANVNPRTISRMDVARTEDDGPISPTRTQSTVNSGTTSTSYASSSPPGPTTPPPRTNRSRYPDLGRVPLHRRGTSKTYERLEDLLKEAGYKETRVFTPETDRKDDSSKPDDKPGGIGAVVEFLTHLFPTAGAAEPDRAEEDETYSPPPSPLQRRDTASSSNAQSPSNESFSDSTPRPARHVSEARNRLLQTYQKFPPPPPADMSRQNSQVILHQPKPKRDAPLAQPQPSLAGAYLRHMASTTSIRPPSRPNSTPAHGRTAFSFKTRRNKRANHDEDDPSIIFSQKGNGEGEEEYQPPLPETWLDSVTRALRFGGHAGGPIHDGYHPTSPRKQQQQQRPQAPQLRTSRSSLSQHTTGTNRHRHGLSDQTNTLLLVPPPLFAMIEQGRAGRSESQVSRTRVVCRSAPGSRATSLTRRGSERRGRGRRKQIQGEADRLPSLARTQTEDDTWNHGKGRPSTANDVKTLYLAGGGIGGDPDSQQSASEEEDEGELNLSRMLVHPKRQHSIKSLRRHLNAAEGVQSRGPSSAGGRRNPKSPLSDEDEQAEEYGGGWTKRSSAGEGDDDEEEAETYARFVGAFDSQGRNGGHSRGAVPAWGGQ